MKILLFIVWLSLEACLGYGQSTIYQTQFQNLEGAQVAMSNLTGKKIIVTVCSVSTPDLTRLRYLDSLYKSNQNNMTLIVVPVQDFDSIHSNLNLNHLFIDSLHFSFIISNPGYGKKAASGQLPILKWLTTESLNSHFDYDLNSIGQTFVISEKGVLFAVLMSSNDLSAHFKALLNAKAPNH